MQTIFLFSSNAIVSQMSLINKDLSEVSNWFKTNELSVKDKLNDYGYPKNNLHDESD